MWGRGGIRVRRRRRGLNDGEDEGALRHSALDLGGVRCQTYFGGREGREGRERETVSRSSASDLGGREGETSVGPVGEREGGEGKREREGDR